MDRYETGMLVRSKAGHDAGKVYVIIKYDDAYVYLADGKIRTIDHLNKKKRKHVQVINDQYDVSAITDVELKRILRLWNKEKRKI